MLCRSLSFIPCIWFSVFSEKKKLMNEIEANISPDLFICSVTALILCTVINIGYWSSILSSVLRFKNQEQGTIVMSEYGFVISQNTVAVNVR